MAARNFLTRHEGDEWYTALVRGERDGWRGLDEALVADLEISRTAQVGAATLSMTSVTDAHYGIVRFFGIDTTQLKLFAFSRKGLLKERRTAVAPEKFVPVPPEAAWLMAASLWASSRRSALTILVLAGTLLRPSGLCSIGASHVLAKAEQPTPGNGVFRVVGYEAKNQSAINRRAGRGSAASAFDVDVVGVLTAGAVVALARLAQSGDEANDGLTSEAELRVVRKDFASAFNDIHCGGRRLADLANGQLYGLRHGAASMLARRGATMDEIRSRGRWGRRSKAPEDHYVQPVLHATMVRRLRASDKPPRALLRQMLHELIEAAPTDLGEPTEIDVLEVAVASLLG